MTDKVSVLQNWLYDALEKMYSHFKRQTNQYEHVSDNESDDESALRSPLQVLSPFDKF